MQVIARIPDVTAPTPDAGMAPARRPARPEPADCDAVRPDRLRQTWPVVALAMAAAVAWVLASRNEHLRLERQRSEMRVAHDTVSAPGAPSRTGGGAVVR